MNRLKQYFQQFFKNLRKGLLDIDKRIFLIAVHDLAFWAVSLFCYLGWTRLIAWQDAKVQFNPPSFDVTNEAMVNVAVQSMTNFLIIALISAIALFVVFALVYSLFQGLVWSTVLRKRFSWTYFKRFSLLNLCWFFAWTLLLVALALALKPGVGTFVILVVFGLMVHFTLVLAVDFTRTQKVRQALSTTISRGWRIHRFVIPYLLIILAYIVVMQFGWIFKILPAYGLDTVFFVIVSLMYFASARIYFAKLI
ncbi:MAG: hypothetical protein V1837_05680 [Candidatus Woesearchaeota archaeon]